MKTTVNKTNKLKKCYVNGNKCKEIYVNNVKVWSGIEHLYNAGDQATDLTGGWTTSRSYILQYSSGLFTPGHHVDSNKLAKFNDDHIYLEIAESSHVGCVAYTAKPINFAEEGIKSITINCTSSMNGWGYEDYKYENIVPYAWWTIGLVPAINKEQTCAKYYGYEYPRGYNGYYGPSDTKVSATFSEQLSDLNKLSGSYYVVVGIYRSVPSAFFSMTINSITCTT